MRREVKSTPVPLIVATKKIVTLIFCCALTACAVSSTPSGPDEAYVKAARAYFKHKCETLAGEKIYKSLAGVKSVQVVNPLPLATERDLYDQFWYGDPYSSASFYKRGERAALQLVSLTAPVAPRQEGKGFDFVEFPNTEAGRFSKLYYLPGAREHSSEAIENPVSRFGVSWEDISTAEDRKYWIAGSRLRVIDLEDNSVVAERIGYLIEPGFGSQSGGRRPWQSARFVSKYTACPETHDYSDRWFLLKALNPPPKLEIIDVDVPALQVNFIGREIFTATTAEATLVSESVMDSWQESSAPRIEGAEVMWAQTEKYGTGTTFVILRSADKKIYIAQGLSAGVPYAIQRFGENVVVAFVAFIPPLHQKKVFIVRKFDANGRMLENLVAYRQKEFEEGGDFFLEGNALFATDSGYLLRYGRALKKDGVISRSIAEVRIDFAK